VETISAVPPPQPEAEPAGPWGFWATIGFSVLIVVGYLAPQFVIGIVWAILEVAGGNGRENNWETFGERLASDGTAVALGTLASVPFVVGLVLWFAWMRKGITVREYLALRWPERGVVIRWCIYLLLFSLGSDALTSLLGRPIVPEFMVDAYRSVGSLKPLLWVAVIIGAPLTEEFFFRGLLFAGLARSRLGSVGAICVTAVLWAIIHLQYDWYGVVTILALGILLGTARLRTGSLWVCILLHAVMNLIATVQVATFLKMLE
jgi:uncharacterized protein